MNLKRCPFCGGEADFRGEIQGYQIECVGSCGARGHSYSSAEYAAEIWNQRAPLAEELPSEMSVDRLVGRINICVIELAKRTSMNSPRSEEK